MKKTIALACLPVLAACSGGGSVGGSGTMSTSNSYTSNSYTVTDNGTSISVSSDPANTDVIAVRNAGTINGTPDAGSTADARQNNLNIATVSDATTNTNAFEKQNTYDGNTSTAMNGWTVKQSQFDDTGSAGHVAGFVEMNRLYNPSGDLVAIETTGTAASNVPNASLRYYGEWNGRIAGTDYENGYVNVVVNTGTNQADLYVYDPTSTQVFINEGAGANTLNYSATNNTVAGAVVFDTGAQTADGQAIMRLYGDHNSSASAEGYVAGQAYTDAGEPFDALIGISAIQD